MKINLHDKDLTAFEREEIESLLKREDSAIASDLDQMWFLMDLVWGDYKCDNQRLNWEDIGKFYSHPVWLLNGLFIEQHEQSMQSRLAIADWVAQHQMTAVADYGGGFGTLARLIAAKRSALKVNIYEPHPSEFGKKRVRQFENIKVVSSLAKDYDCLLCTDVLEHVPDPLMCFAGMLQSVKPGGYLIIANCFYPVIKCHLPRNFHFRHSFNFFVRAMGVEVIGLLEGSHATIYRRIGTRKLNWALMRVFERFSQLFFAFRCGLSTIRRYIRTDGTLLTKRMTLET